MKTKPGVYPPDPSMKTYYDCGMSYLATRKSNDLILINLDQEKAFDRVNRTFLNKVMEWMNFGLSFRHWLEIMYKSATSNITNNGYLSGPVHLHRGIRQGCPLSPLLYTLVIETLIIIIIINFILTR